MILHAFSMVWLWFVTLCFPCVREYIEVRAKPALFFIIPATSGMLSKHLDSLSSLRDACLADLKQYSGQQLV